MATVLDELERLDKGATPGPWLVRDDVFGSDPVVSPEGGYAICEIFRQRDANGTPAYDADANAKLVAAMREAFPSLLAAARAIDDLAMYAGLVAGQNSDLDVAAQKAHAALAPLLKEME